MLCVRERYFQHLGWIICAALAASCTQPAPVIEPNDPSAPTTIAITKPPQDPILRIETEMHTARISHISVDGTGRYLVTASDDKTLRVWEAPTGRLLRVLRPPIGQGNEGKMYAVAISPDGNTIAGAGWSGLEWDRSHSIYLFDKSSGRMLKRITGLPQSIPHLAFSPDGRVLLVTFHGKSGIRFYRTADSALLAEDRDYRGETYGASFDASGRVVTASYDGFLRLYGRDFTLLAQTQVPGEKRPFTVSMTANGSKIAAGYENSAQVDVFSGETLQYLYSPDTSDIKKGYLNVVSWSFDGDTLYAGGQYRIDDKHPIRKWAKQGQGQWIDLPASSNTILRIVPLSTGGIAYGSSDPAFGVFDARDARILYKGSDVLDYRDSHEKFLLSHDGATVQFAYNKGRQFTARFSVVDRLLEQNPVSPATLHPPRTTAPGLAIENWKNSQAPTLNDRPLRLLQYEVSRSVAIAPDDQTILMGTVWHLRLFDRQGRELWRVPAPANVWSVTIAGNGLVATAALADGTIRWYRMADGQELLALFPHPDTKRWVAWTPSGYYDAAPGAEALLGWHKNYSGDAAADFFPAAQFRSVSYKPVVVKEVLETLDEQQAVRRTSINTTLKPSVEPKTEESQTTKLLPLSVAIISPSDGAALSSTTVKIRYRVGTESSGSPNDIIAMVDGRTISTSRGIAVVDASAAAGVRELEVQIPERDCEVSLAVTNRSGGRGKPASVRLKWKPAFAVKPMLYVVAIGVSNGENEKPTATLAGKDAQDFAAALQLQTGNLYRGVTAKVLADDQASKDSILDALDWLDRETTGKDVAMIFMKGQAVSDKNGIPYFLAAGSKTNQLRRTALPFSDIRNVIGALAGRSVIFMDACQAGDLRSTEACAGAVTNLVSDLSSSEQGAVVFSSSTAKHYAQENAAWGNGAFTMALIEGLKGKASYNESRNITVSMLDLYLSERIKSVTKGQQISASAKTYDLPDFVLAAPQEGSPEIARSSAAPYDSSKQVPSQQNEILRRLPPVVTILSPQDGTAASATNLTIRYEVRIPTGEPVTEIIGLLDGRPFPIPISRPALRGGQESPNLEIRELQVEVPERESEISILAKNRWASSEPSTIRVRWEKHGRPAASLPKPTLHALVIGVSRYDDSSLALQFSAKDAIDFASALKRQQGGLYKAVVTKVLTDAEATKENILEGLDWLDRETARNDVAVVFLAGHGVNDKNGVYYFLPVNAKTDRLRRTGLAFSDIKNTVASLAGKTLLFADTCHAGNILGRRRGAVDINAVVNELTSAENGAVVFASSTGKQDSLEDPIWGNGAFTKALVEALNGKAAYGGSKKITINMLDLYLSERVKELTRGQQTPTTTKPQTIQDFPIAIQLGPA